MIAGRIRNRRTGVQIPGGSIAKDTENKSTIYERGIIMMIIDRSYNKFTIDEILDMTAGCDKIGIAKDFTETFDLIYALSDMGGEVSAYGHIILVSF